MRYPELEPAEVQDWSNRDRTMLCDYLKSRGFDYEVVDTENYEGIKPDRPDLRFSNNEYQFLAEVKSFWGSDTDRARSKLFRRIEKHLEKVHQGFDYWLLVADNPWNPDDKELRHLRLTVEAELNSLPDELSFPYPLRLGGHPREELYKKLVVQQPENRTYCEKQLEKLREEGNGQVSIRLVQTNHSGYMKCGLSGVLGPIKTPRKDDDWLRNAIGEARRQLKAIAGDVPRVIVILNHAGSYFDEYDCQNAMFGDLQILFRPNSRTHEILDAVSKRGGGSSFQKSKNTTISALVISAHTSRSQMYGDPSPYIVYHNQFAKNPLRTDIFKDGKNLQYTYTNEERCEIR